MALTLAAATARANAQPNAAKPQASQLAPKAAPVGNQARLRVLQAKLTVGAASDPLEREADFVAEQVMRMPALKAPVQVNRKCKDCEEEATLRAKPEGESMTESEAPDTVEPVLRAPGQPLDLKLRGFFEPRFGMDFSNIRVHRDAQAARSARDVGARAYAAGDHIVFGAGQFVPESQDGRRLLAHELTHTVQQSSAARPATIRRETPPAPPAGGGTLTDQAKLQSSKDVIEAVNRRNPDPDVNGPGDFPAAFNILNGLSMPAMLATLDELKTLGIFALLEPEIGNAKDVDKPRIEVAMAAVKEHGAVTFDQFKSAHSDAISALPDPQPAEIQSFMETPAPGAAAKPAADPNAVANLGAGEKLSRALDYARDQRDASWNQAIEGLKSKQSIATMVVVAGAFIAAQAIPVTWIADAALLTGLTIAGFFLGVSIGTFVVDIGKFFAAIGAQTDADLQASGKALADAVAIFGIFAITGALSEGIGAGIRGAKTTPSSGPPMAGFTDAYATNAGLIKVPNEMMPADPPTFPSKSLSTGGGKGGAKTAPPAGKAPPAGEAPVDPVPGAEAQKPNAPATETPAGPPPGAGNGLPGFRTEPSLKNAGWGPPPDGGAKGAPYAKQVTGSSESLYIGGLKQKLGGTGVVELDGFRAADRILLDAKDARVQGSMYDLSGALKTPPDRFTMEVKIPNLLKEAVRQEAALEQSGAAGIEWHISDEPIANLVRTLLSNTGSKIQVIYSPKTPVPPTPP